MDWSSSGDGRAQERRRRLAAKLFDAIVVTMGVCGGGGYNCRVKLA